MSEENKVVEDSFVNQNYSLEKVQTISNQGEKIIEDQTEGEQEEDNYVQQHSTVQNKDKGTTINAGNAGNDMEENINQVSIDGDLSPRQASALKTMGAKVEVPLRVQTRSSKGRTTNCPQ